VIESTLVASGIRTREAAFDVAQEVALKVWQALGDLRDSARFPQWLRQITANAARDHLRRCAARREAGPGALDSMVVEDDPGERLERRLDNRRMLAALREEDSESAGLLLARAEGASIADLAARSHLSQAALKMRLTRARQRLIRRLARLRGDDAP
jgi:RNA polymerase sigma-70 factor (ECF subfamily)